jgi:hypothetical protein
MSPIRVGVGSDLQERGQKMASVDDSEEDLLEDLIPWQKVAASLKKSTRTMDRYRRAGQGPAYIQIGRDKYCTPRALKQYVIDLEVDPAKRGKR